MKPDEGIKLPGTHLHPLPSEAADECSVPRIALLQNMRVRLQEVIVTLSMFGVCGGCIGYNLRPEKEKDHSERLVDEALPWIIILQEKLDAQVLINGPDLEAQKRVLEGVEWDYQLFLQQYGDLIPRYRALSLKNAQLKSDIHRAKFVLGRKDMQF